MSRDVLEVLLLANCPPVWKVVLMVIARHGRGAFPGLQRIARLAGISRPTLLQILKQLAARGWLTWIPGNAKTHTANTYTIHFAKIPPLGWVEIRRRSDSDLGKSDGKARSESDPQALSTEVRTKAISEAKASSPRRSAGGEHKGNTPEEEIYRQYPRKVGHKVAIEAIRKAVQRIRKGENVIAAIPDLREAQIYLYRRIQAYARSPAGTRPDRDKIPHPATWLNASRYLDDDQEWQVAAPPRAAPNGRAAAPKPSEINYTDEYRKYQQ